MPKYRIHSDPFF